MGSSSIAVSSLVAAPTLQGNKLTPTLSGISSGPSGDIPSLRLDAVEYYASQTNDFSTAALIGSGAGEFVHAGLNEEETWYYWAKPRAVNRNYGAVYPVSPTGGVQCTTIGQSGLAFGLSNGKIQIDDHSSDATVSAGALRIAIKTATGADPSTSNPVRVAFRSANSATGGYTIRQFTSATSITIPSGKSVNLDSATDPFRLSILAYDNGAGSNPVIAVAAPRGLTVFDELGSISCSNNLSNAGVSLGTFPVSTSSPSTTRYRLIGYADWQSGLSSLGTWTAPSPVVLIGPSTRKTGDIVQRMRPLVFGIQETGSSTIPWDNTIPQSTEGDFLTGANLDGTPNPCNWMRTKFTLIASLSSAGHIIAAMFKGAGADAIAAAAVYVGGADQVAEIILEDYRLVGTGSSQINIRVGSDVGATWRTAGTSAGRKLGGVMLETRLEREEIMG